MDPTQYHTYGTEYGSGYGSGYGSEYVTEYMVVGMVPLLGELLLIAPTIAACN